MSSQETADKILGAFLSLTAERGMSRLTPRDIAAAAGVFRYFAGKAPWPAAQYAGSARFAAGSSSPG